MPAATKTILVPAAAVNAVRDAIHERLQACRDDTETDGPQEKALESVHLQLEGRRTPAHARALKKARETTAILKEVNDARYHTMKHAESTASKLGQAREQVRNLEERLRLAQALVTKMELKNVEQGTRIRDLTNELAQMKKLAVFKPSDHVKALAAITREAMDKQRAAEQEYERLAKAVRKLTGAIRANAGRRPHPEVWEALQKVETKVGSEP